MKWTPDEDAELRALVLTCGTVEEIAERMPKRPAGVRRYAHLHGIILPDEPGLRARWATLIEPMKAKLRASIGE